MEDVLLYLDNVKENFNYIKDSFIILYTNYGNLFQLLIYICINICVYIIKVLIINYAYCPFPYM